MAGRPTPRVLLGLGEVSGYYAGLRRGFEDLGVPVTLLDLEGHPYSYGGGHVNPGVRAATWLSRRELGSRGLRRVAFRTARVAVQGALLAWALPRHDVFVFSHGASFLGQWDLGLIRRCGKRVVCAYHGNDSRPPYLSSYWGVEPSPRDARRRIRQARGMKRRVRRVERHAHGLVNIPSQGYFHERPYALGLYMGLPTGAAGCEPAAPPEKPPGADVVCLHAPSNPVSKGTEEIRTIVARLRERGLPVVLHEITGASNADVLDAMRRCDVVLDQLYADYGSPGLATEAAWFGRPVVIGGYGADLWRELLPPQRLPKTCYVHPKQVEEVLATLVLDADLRREQGERARSFVETYWRPAQVAARYLRLAHGEIPERWMFDPRRSWDPYACFLPEERARAIVRGVLRAGGAPALQLEDKPDMRRRVVEFGGRDAGV